MEYEFSPECGHVERQVLGTLTLSEKRNVGAGFIDAKLFGKKCMDCIKKLNEFERVNGTEAGKIVCPGPVNGECQADIVLANEAFQAEKNFYSL